MADITKQPLEDGFETSLSQSWDGTVGTVNVNAVPNFTFPSGVTTYIVVNPKNTGIQVAEIDSYDPVAKTLNVTNVTLELGAGYPSTTKTHSVTSKVIISNNYENWKHIKEVIETKVNKDVDSTIDDTIKLNFGADSYIVTDNDGLDIKFKDGNNAETTLSTLTAGAGADRKVAVSDTDTTAGQLDDKIVQGSGIILNTLNPGADEQIEVSFDTNALTVPSTQSDVTLGETVAVGDALRNGNTTIAPIEQLLDNNVANVTNSFGQTFTVLSDGMITDIEVLIRNGGSTANTKVEILDGIGGTIIGTSEIKDITNSSNEFINFNFSAPVSVTSSTQYYFRLPETSGPLQYATYSLDVYAGGQRVDNGSATSGETVFIIHSINNEDISKVYLTDTSSVNKINFIGFASESGVLDDVKKLNTAGVDSNQSFSASDIGKDSYLSDTPGQISTTPGTNVVKVGKILSTTELLINTLADKAEDVDFLNFTTAGGSASYETTYSHDLGKIPTKFECFTKNYATSSATSSFGWFENGQYASLGHEGGSRDDCMGQVFYSSGDYFKMTVSEITNTSFKIIYTEVGSCSTVSSYGVVLKIS